MKQTVFILALAFSIFSCNSKPSEKFKPINDSLVVVLFRNAQGGPQMQRAKFSTKQVKAVDSLDKIVTKVDTSWQIELPNPKDTIKDAHSKPLYDSINHTYRFNNYWYKLTDQENKTVKIQIVNI